jgi:hypothetical protein
MIADYTGSAAAMQQATKMHQNTALSQPSACQPLPRLAENHCSNQQ